MKSYLKLVLGMAGLTAAAPMLPAIDVTTTYSVQATNSYVPRDYSGSNSLATSSSSAVVVALNGQALLLKEMLQEHQKKAAELTQQNQGEKARWETELVNELQEKSGRVQKSIEQMSQREPVANDLKAAGGDVDDQLAFVSTLEARLEQLHQELSAALGDSHVLSMQVATNKAPENIAAISSVLSDNQKLVKELQREQFDLELRKLEFRAIRKVIQK